LTDDLITRVSGYYSDKVREFGPSPRGVDWNSAESQHLRFDQLAKILPEGRPFSLLDFGCGYGALYEYLAERRETGFEYAGVDISDEMLAQARSLVQRQGTTLSFQRADGPIDPADYAVASGVFNVRLDCPMGTWQDYVEETIGRLHELSRAGFAFNILTSYSDPPRRRDYLYYADPRHYFDLCKRRFSRNVALLHDYDLYEFTILVRKAPR
jgi:SAM-dependent methyltransferase